jgi:Domain of unknown function (DUF4407)
MTFQSHFDFGPLSQEGNRVPLSTRARFALRQTFRRIRDLTLFFGGGDVEEARTVPQAETSSLRVDGTILMLSMIINCAIWFAALIYADLPGPLALIIAIFITSLIGLFDRQILSSLLAVEGEAILRSAGMQGLHAISRNRRKLLTAGRIALSFSTMAAVSILVRIALFAPDIDAELDRANKALNRDLRNHAAQIVDRQISDARSAFATAVAERNALSATVGKTDAAADTSGVDASIAGLQGDIRKAESEMQSVAAEYYSLQRAKTAEEKGVKVAEGDSGIAGRGERYTYAADRMRQAGARYSFLKGSIAATQAKIAVLRSERGALISGEGQAASARRAELAPRLAAADARVGQLGARRSALEGNRPAAFTILMANDPTYISPRSGMMARVEALSKISYASYATTMLSFSFALVLSILEMAVIWARALLGVPNISGAKRVLENKAALDRFLMDYQNALFANKDKRKFRDKPKGDSAPPPSTPPSDVLDPPLYFTAKDK